MSFIEDDEEEIDEEDKFSKNCAKTYDYIKKLEKKSDMPVSFRDASAKERIIMTQYDPDDSEAN